MKTRKIFTCGAAALCMAFGLLFTACNEIDSEKGAVGAVSLNVKVPGGTKAVDVTELAKEKAVSTLDVFLFKAGENTIHLQLADMTAGASSWTATITDLKAGEWTVRAIANAPAGVSDLGSTATEAQLDAIAISLSNCDVTGSGGFVMEGAASAVILNATTTNVSVGMSRYVARVKLGKVSNNVGAQFGNTLKVKGAYLENVYGKWVLKGGIDTDSPAAAGNPNGWINLAGRKYGQHASTATTDFIRSKAAAQASLPSGTDYTAQTFYEAASADQAVTYGGEKAYNKFFYAMPSVIVKSAGITQDSFAGAVASNAAGQGILPRLVIVAEVGGVDWYYPVTLYKNGAGLLRNTAYEVNVTINGPGSDDPNKPVVDGNITAVISVNGWTAGAEYTDQI